jgi:hypothetical protein
VGVFGTAGRKRLRKYSLDVTAVRIRKAWFYEDIADNRFVHPGRIVSGNHRVLIDAVIMGKRGGPRGRSNTSSQVDRCLAVFHRAGKEKKQWDVEVRKALLEEGNIAAELDVRREVASAPHGKTRQHLVCSISRAQMWRPKWEVLHELKDDV